jgi:hypothetical protein
VRRAIILFMILVMPLAASAAGGGAMDIKSDELRSSAKKSGITKSMTTKSPSLKVSGVLFGGGQALAVIDNAYYHVGDLVRGYRLNAVGDRGVYLERDGVEHFVGIGR